MIAETLAREGLHLGATTVGRMLRHEAPHMPQERADKSTATAKRLIVANRPDHIWHVDLTTVPTAGGF